MEEHRERGREEERAGTGGREGEAEHMLGQTHLEQERGEEALVFMLSNLNKKLKSLGTFPRNFQVYLQKQVLNLLRKKICGDVY